MTKSKTNSKSSSIKEETKAALREAARQRKELIKKEESEWYNLRPILGHANWALFYILCGGREVGKSYAITNFFVDQYKRFGIPFT